MKTLSLFFSNELPPEVILHVLIPRKIDVNGEKVSTKFVVKSYEASTSGNCTTYTPIPDFWVDGEDLTIVPSLPRRVLALIAPHFL